MRNVLATVGTTDRVCMIIGILDNIRQVHNFILDKVKEKPEVNPGGIVGELKAKIVVPNSTASLIIGKNGENIKTIKDATNVFIQVSPKSKDTEKPLSERIITVSGDSVDLQQAVDMILEKIVEDPQSGTCTNVSYADGPIPPQNSHSSLTSTNLTSSLHLPVTGHPTMEALKFILRAKGYNEPSTREITAAIYTLASYGFVQLRTPPQQDWSSGGEGTAPDYYPQASDTGSGTLTASEATGNQMQDYNNYYNSYYGAGYGSGGYNNSMGYDYSNYGSYGNSGMQGGMQDMTQQGSYGTSSSASNFAGSGVNYPTTSGQYSMESSGYPGSGSGDYGASSSSATPQPTANNSSVTRQEVDVSEQVAQAMMGAEGKGIMEIQQWTGAQLEVVQKTPYVRTVKVSGSQNSVQMVMYMVHQYVQQAEYRQYCEGQAAQQGNNNQWPQANQQGNSQWPQANQQGNNQWPQNYQGNSQWSQASQQGNSQ